MKIEHIIFGVHGIRTSHENWSDSYRRINDEKHPSIAVEEYDYGCILGMQMYACGIVPFLGWNMMDSFYAWIKNTLKEYKDGTPYSIVSHSFGTWITHGMLYRHPDIEPEANVIIGSVLSEYFKKTKFPMMMKRKQIERMMVLYSEGDNVVNTLSKYPFGRNGVTGFIDKIPDNVEQVKHTGDHSDYFTKTERLKTYELITTFCIGR